MDGWLWTKWDGIGAAAAALAAGAALTGALVPVAPAPDGRGEPTARPAGTAAVRPDDEDEVANASLGLDVSSTDGTAVVAAFARRSYRPGDTAVLEFWHRYPVVRAELIRLGVTGVVGRGGRALVGVRAGRAALVAAGRTSTRLRIGDWQSGVYMARLTAAGRIGFAPFVLRPRRLGTSRVAVVQPTNTWQAYNFRDGDGDGRPDSWYFDSHHNTVSVSRPYLEHGLPPHFRQYDLGFLHWLARKGKQVDMLAEEDLERLSGDRLARLYTLIVFPGHHEYVTQAEYDAVERYRDLGGNLAFLSANNFFSRVERRGDRLTRLGRWRDFGRPESALTGVQYFQWNLGTYGSRPFVARGVQLAPWLFAGTRIENGEPFGWWGIEVDRRTPASPRSTSVLAEIPHAFGSAHAAQMTYYETPRGARVFSAGAFSLGGAATRWTASHLLMNLWAHLADDERSLGRSGR